MAYKVGDNGKAYFFHKPFSLDDLRVPHRMEQESYYDIKAVVTLPEIEYENFITDMTQWREFIEQHGKLCNSKDDVWSCIFVHQVGKTDGVLVQTDGYDYPRYAAYLPKTDE
jgi:hypothetical protein